MICDSHVHFFSPGFFAGLGADRSAITALGWEFPDSTEALSARWIGELDKHGVDKAALMASLPGDADSVAKAVALNPSRFVGFFMLDPTRADAIDYARRALDEGLRTVCLFPAMHRYALHDDRVASVFELAASRRGGTAGQGRCLRTAARPLDRHSQKARPAEPVRDALRQPAHLHALALKYRPCRSSFRTSERDAARSVDARGLLSNVHLDTSSSNSWIKYTPGLTLEQVFKARAMWSGLSACCSEAIPRFFHGDGTARSIKTKVSAQRHWRERGPSEQDLQRELRKDSRSIPLGHPAKTSRVGTSRRVAALG